MYIWIISILLIITVCFLFSNTFKENYRKVKTIYEVYKNITSTAPLAESVSVIEGNTMKIEYTYNQQKYQIRVPFSQMAMMDMIDLQVTANCKDGPKDITHQPGIVYDFTPNDIGCDSVDVHNMDSGETVSYYGNQKINI